MLSLVLGILVLAGCATKPCSEAAPAKTSAVAPAPTVVSAPVVSTPVQKAPVTAKIPAAVRK